MRFEWILLARHAFDSKDSEFRVLVADFASFQISRRRIRRFRLVDVLKNRQNDARFWRLARETRFARRLQVVFGHCL